MASSDAGAIIMSTSDAGTSSGSEYQVFLSFRGPDTRNGFTDVLFHSLTDAGICVFRDDEELRVGEIINGSLLQAIDNSIIYIPIFSQTYASSHWCLRELAHIVANFKLEDDKVILPIFFDVEPDDVKLKTTLYRNAILNLKSQKKLREEEVDAWIEALKVVGGARGWEVKNYMGHGKVIRSVVEEVLERLKIKHKSVTEHLIGMDAQVAAVSKLVKINSNDVRLIKIHGMGGIGKTTLAKVIFNQFSSYFGKYCCFLEEVDAKSSKLDGLVDLQKRLLSEIGPPAGTRSINDIDYGMKRTGEVLCNKKVLIVLDDVDNDEQVEKLLGKTTLFLGSRILITTRNRNVQRIKSSKYRILDYEMELMSNDNALHLFRKLAFGGFPESPYKYFSQEIVDLTGRLPLTLTVIGSLLRGEPQEIIWKETLEKLKKAPPDDVIARLKISYDHLSFEQQQIFLDIACFLVGEDKTNAIYMWKECNIFANVEVDALKSRSLVKIVEKNKFWMHNQLRDLGRRIVYLEDPLNPSRRSRIWNWVEGLDAMASKEMDNNVQALSLETFGRRLSDVVVQSEEVGRFQHLRFLKLSGFTLVGDALSHTKLRWISFKYPLHINNWTTIYLKSIVILELFMVDSLDDSGLQHLIKVTTNLKVLHLEKCKNIIRVLDLSGCPNLHRLTFKECHNLREIDGSIGKLKRLIDLRIELCHLEGLPEEIGDLVNLQHLFISCLTVMRPPNTIWKLKSLREVHFLNMSGDSHPPNSWELPSASEMLRNLVVLHVETGNLKGKLPDWIGSLPLLGELNLSGTCVSEVPKTISMLTHLQRIELRNCDEIQELPMLPKSLTHLKVSSSSLKVVPDLSNLTNLVELDLCDRQQRGDKHVTGELWWIGRLSQLTKLSISLHGVPVPTEIASLHLLKELRFFGSDMQNSGLLNLSYLQIFDSLMQEIQLDGLQLPQLKEIVVRDCNHRLKLSRMWKLEDVDVYNCPKLVEIQLFGALESLESLSIRSCNSFKMLVYEPANELIRHEGRLIFPSRVLKKLRTLILWDCPEILEIQVEGASASWEHLDVCLCPCLQGIHGLSYLENLKSFSIGWCDSLRVVEGVNELESLGKLHISGCGSLERLINMSTTKLPDDCHVFINDCRKLHGVKKGFCGSVQSLKHYKEQDEAAPQQEEREEDATQQKEEREEDAMQCLDSTISEVAQQQEEKRGLRHAIAQIGHLCFRSCGCSGGRNLRHVQEVERENECFKRDSCDISKLPR